MPTPLRSPAAAIRGQALILAAGILLLILKLLAWFLTDSDAVLTDALESIINVLAGAFALYSLHYAARPRDHNHPYGHGKIEFLSSGLEGMLILIAGVAMIGKAVYGFFYPPELSHLDWGLALTSLTGLANGLMGHWARRQDSLVLQAEGKHLTSDAWSSLGLLLGLGLIWLTGLRWLDQVAALVFGGVIAYTGLRVMRTAVAGVMDEVDEALIAQIARILEENRQDQWIDVHNLRVIRYGPAIHIDCHLTLPWYYSLERAHVEVKAVEQLLAQQLAGPVECFIHADPCRPISCHLCAVSDCPHRQAPYLGHRPAWTQDLLRGEQHH